MNNYIKYEMYINKAYPEQTEVPQENLTEVIINHNRDIARQHETERNRDYQRQYIHKHRSKLQYTDITKDWLNDLFNSTLLCPLCGCELDNNGRTYPSGKQLDHIIPLGGTHTMDNVRFICLKCNVSRPKKGYDIQ